MGKYRLCAAGVHAVVVLGIGGRASNVNALLETTVATQGSQETSKEEAIVEDAIAIELATSAIESMEESQAETPQSARIYGSVTKMEDGRLSIDNQSGISSSGEITLNVSSDATYTLDAVTGLPIKVEDTKDEKIIYAYVGPTMAMSLPPMTNTEVIFANVPADVKVPGFVEVKSMITDAATSKPALAVAGDTEYILAPDCNMFPYLTRNTVILNDLTQGRKCAI